jgi:sec-independent protein translocase protein TatC
MYLLKKVFQLRDHVNPEHEKPFLDHLEDLRVMVFKVAITLIVSMCVSFIFQDQLMELLRRPMDQVFDLKSEAELNHSPTAVTPEEWDMAKEAEHASATLLPGERELFFKSINNPAIQFHIRSIALERAALVIPDHQRDAFLNAATPDPKIRQQVKFLIDQKVSPDIASKREKRMMTALQPTETFMLSMKLAFFAGIVLAFPLLMMFILQFVLPGLHHNEQRVLWPALAIGFGLFLIGVCFAYFLVLPRALEFFYSYSETMGVSNDWRIGEYMSFATTFTLLFGLSFELPVVVMVVVKLGLLSYATMKSTRRYAIVGVTVLAAVLTPTPDVITLSLMAVPMYLLYEICIWLAYFSEKKEKKKEADEAKERMDRLLRDYEKHENIQAEVTTLEAHDDGWKAETPPAHDTTGSLPEHTETPPEISPDADDDKRPRGDA